MSKSRFLLLAVLLVSSAALLLLAPESLALAVSTPSDPTALEAQTGQIVPLPRHLEPRSAAINDRARVLWLVPSQSASCRQACSRVGLASVSSGEDELCAVQRGDSLVQGTSRPIGNSAIPLKSCQHVEYVHGSPKVFDVPVFSCGCLPPKNDTNSPGADSSWTESICPSGYTADRARICLATQSRRPYFGYESSKNDGTKVCASYFPWNPSEDKPAYGAAFKTYKILCVPAIFRFLEI